jgi:hypothetical protein
MAVIVVFFLRILFGPILDKIYFVTKKTDLKEKEERKGETENPLNLPEINIEIKEEEEEEEKKSSE